MATTITRDIIESYLNCKYKGHLKLAGENGTPSDYETMTTAVRASSREQAIARLVACFGGGDAHRGTTVTAAILKQAMPLLVDADLEDRALRLRYDALKRVDGGSKLGDYHYIPILHNHEDTLVRRQKILLAILGLALARVQELRPAYGMIARGPEARLGKVRLDPKLYRQAEEILGEMSRFQADGEPPRLMLNSHCHLCEFRQRCRTSAERADDISLLGGVGEKELKRYNRKGIFTITQLSCTFRPRKKGKRVKRKDHVRYSALQALAIREKKVHIYGTPDLTRKPVQIFLDAEGNEDGSFIYLLGVLVVDGDAQRMYSFWADSPAEETQALGGRPAAAVSARLMPIMTHCGPSLFPTDKKKGGQWWPPVCSTRSRRSRRRPVVAFGPLGVLPIDTVQQHGQFSGAQGDSSLAFGRRRETEGSSLMPLTTPQVPSTKRRVPMITEPRGGITLRDEHLGRHEHKTIGHPRLSYPQAPRCSWQGPPNCLTRIRPLSRRRGAPPQPQRGGLVPTHSAVIPSTARAGDLATAPARRGDNATARRPISGTWT